MCSVWNSLEGAQNKHDQNQMSWKRLFCFQVAATVQMGDRSQCQNQSNLKDLP